MTFGQRLTRGQIEETCYHEAGHVVASRAFGARVDEVSVSRQSQTLAVGETRGLDGYTARSMLPDLAEELVVGFAGLEAQFTLLRGRTPTPADYETDLDGDFQNIAFCSQVVAVESSRDLGDVLLTAQRTARDLVLARRSDVQKVARALLKRQHLTGRDLDALLGPMPFVIEVDHAELDAAMRRRIALLRAKGQKVAKSRWDGPEEDQRR